ncbi:hypothetical protein QJS04_geneDACA015265 [Acorus gramineus]|uniref:F-box domain-containing protein n=1 Tax=Acorus gramineus TaxID=55184 RepID=A0AAV9ASD6_ACOGR|nr:hypothetical protein QJS04_geneDACA015265 [Acorus gramineus]
MVSKRTSKKKTCEACEACEAKLSRRNSRPISKRKPNELKNHNNNKKNRTRADWGGISRDLLECITNRLSLRDYIRFRAVCHEWSYATVKFNRPFLFLARKIQSNKRVIHDPLDRKTYEIDRPEFYRNYLLGSSFGWLILGSFERRQLSLLNPFSGECVVLPLPPLKKKIRMYEIWDAVTLSSPPTSPNCIVLVLQALLKRILYCRIGDDKWDQIEDELFHQFGPNQAIWYTGNFYVLSRTGLIHIDVVTKQLKMIALPQSLSSDYRDRHVPYIVESRGEILLVIVKFTQHFEVFKMDHSSGNLEWERMEGLGGRTIFLEHGSAVCVDASEAGCRGDCIFYTRKQGKRLWNMFDMESKKLQTGPTQHMEKKKNYLERVWCVPSKFDLMDVSGLIRLKSDN